MTNVLQKYQSKLNFYKTAFASEGFARAMPLDSARGFSQTYIIALVIGVCPLLISQLHHWKYVQSSSYLGGKNCMCGPVWCKCFSHKFHSVLYCWLGVYLHWIVHMFVIHVYTLSPYRF